MEWQHINGSIIYATDRVLLFERHCKSIEVHKNDEVNDSEVLLILKQVVIKIGEKVVLCTKRRDSDLI